MRKGARCVCAALAACAVAAALAMAACSGQANEAELEEGAQTPVASEVASQDAAQDEGAAARQGQAPAEAEPQAMAADESGATGEPEATGEGDQAAAPGEVEAATRSASVQNDYENIPAENVLSVDDFALAAQDPGERTILDTRTRSDFFMFHFEWDAVNIPADQLAVRSREVLEMEGGILLVSKDAAQADAAFTAIADAGYPTEKVLVLDGGVAGWMASGNTSVPMKFQQLGC